PEHDQMWIAVRGHGTRRNGELVRTPPRRALPSMRVGVLSRFLDEPTRSAVHERRLRFGTVAEGPRCAGVAYPQLIAGRYDAVLFWRTLPWDHAPGVLLLEEAGGSALRVDGSAYTPGDEQVGLLAVGAAAGWREVRDSLLGCDPTIGGPVSYERDIARRTRSGSSGG
ncbi:MAG TPA: inositol monophosphatase family protein, partial [Mycobacteriales bacterium]|nr:inositol monophosphatase family protein [Mycobacteriales bacterium]